MAFACAIGAFGAAALAASACAEDLCPGIQVTSRVHPAFDATEKRLVCGDKSNVGGKGEGWSSIPPNQAIFELKNFLQSRGYLNPQIQQNGSRIVIDPGSVTKVTSIRIEGDQDGLKPEKKRELIGAPMTPKRLTEVEDWAKHILSSRGYPCATIKATGEKDGVITLSVHQGSPVFLNGIDSVGLRTLDARVLRRFDPFSLGDRYDSDLLALSADRAVRDGAVERSFFAPVCPEGKARQNSIEGDPRILTFGVSVNTEEVGVVQGSIERVRIGENASSAFLGTQASFKSQELSSYFDWHLISPDSRQWLRPQIQVKHQNEDPFQVVEERGQLGWNVDWDWIGAGFGLMVGPQIEWFQTLRGSPTSRPYITTLSGELGITGHEFEFNRNKLGGGFRFRANVDSGTGSVLSNFGATRMRAKADESWNIGNFDPPFLLVTLRLAYAATLVEGGPARAGSLPPDWYDYLGGNSDLRGFGRLELGSGFPGESLSAGYAGLELRPGFFGESLQPFVFADAGLLSYQTYAIKAPIYWDPGLGISLKSPIGTAQATIAHGFVAGNGSSAVPSSFSHWQFFFSLGEPL